jgi:hypothetical protein
MSHAEGGTLLFFHDEDLRRGQAAGRVAERASDPGRQGVLAGFGYVR